MKTSPKTDTSPLIEPQSPQSPLENSSLPSALPSSLEAVTPAEGGDTCCGRLRSALFNPKRVLLIFCIMNFITYYDRGVIAASIPSIKSDTTMLQDGQVLTSAQGGALVSVFMVGYMITCPIFAMLEKWIKATSVVCIGLLVWCTAVIAGCTTAQSYYMLIISRALVGIGEAAYAGFTVTMIDDMAPVASRTMWLGAFFAMIPVGQASGLAAGGIISSYGNIMGMSGWRFAFLTEGFVMAPIVLCIFVLPSQYNPKKKRDVDPDATLNAEAAIDKEKRMRSVPPNPLSSTSSVSEAPADINPIEAIWILLQNSVWIATVAGYGMFTFVIGGLAVWCLTFLEQGPLQMSSTMASIMFGLTTVITGLLGTATGGKILDSMGGSAGTEGVKKCHKFNTVCVFVGLPLAIIALLTENVFVFFTLLFLAEFLMFCTSAPVNAAIISIVSANVRTYSMSYSVFFMHACGDFPSAIVAGALADSFSLGCDSHQTSSECLRDNSTRCEWIIGQNETGGQVAKSYCVNELQMRNSLLIVVSMLIVCGLFWALAWYLTIRMQRRIRQGSMAPPK